VVAGKPKRQNLVALHAQHLTSNAGSTSTSPHCHQKVALPQRRKADSCC
jgi:hypothetical protein